MVCDMTCRSFQIRHHSNSEQKRCEAIFGQSHMAITDDRTHPAHNVFHVAIQGPQPIVVAAYALPLAALWVYA